MTTPTAALLASLIAVTGAMPVRAAERMMIAQATDAAPAVPQDAPGTSAASQPAPDAPPSVTSIYQAPPAPPASPAAPAESQAPVAPPITGSLRNGTGASPSGGVAGAAQTPSGSSVTFGGPQIDTAPVYGSTLRDGGAGNGGVPVYSSAPQALGGPVNGTANNYAVSPPGTTSGNAGTGTRRGGTDVTSSTRQPLGGAPYTRDQVGNFGGRNGYTASGVYNGTAGQTAGVGYGSPYAPSGRPVGGYVSTGVDATGPLRPYIPLNTGTIGHPNSGYGVPNGSRPTTMDGRGIQRVN